MVILIFGATGKMGQLVVQEALKQGHNVKAFVRNPAGMRITDKKLSVVQGNLSDTKSIIAALKGVDVAISTLGGKSITKRDPMLVQGTQNILSAMEQSAAKRLLFISAFGVGDSYQHAAFPLKILFRTLLRVPYADKFEQEKMIRATSLDWTIVRPTRLVETMQKTTYRSGETLDIGVNSHMTREKIAEFMIRQLKKKDYIKKVVTIGS